MFKADASVEAVLTAIKSTSWQRQRMHELSRGERQRTLLRWALATESSVLPLVEPATHINAPHQVAPIRFLHRHVRAVITTLHDLTLGMRADRLLIRGYHGARREQRYRLHEALTDASNDGIAVSRARTKRAAHSCLAALRLIATADRRNLSI